VDGARWSRIAAFAGIAAVVIAIAAYRKAGGEPPPPPAAPVHDPALDLAIQRLESRLAAVERAVSSIGNATGQASSANHDEPKQLPALPEQGSAGSTGSAGSAVAPVETPEQHKQRVATVVDRYWRDWADRNHVDPTKTEALTALQIDASARRLDTQTKVSAKEMSSQEARAANLLITEEVRRKARELLTPEQFTQFETDHGAELGSSYRAVRDALTKAAAANR
jgi:hypothetical protein